MTPRALDRSERLERLGSERFDLLVIGGGIVGAGIAEAASAHGLRVALVEKGDFAGATSSASSKLIHGGLRYLRLGDVGLVREAHNERRVLMNVVAPHLVQRRPFLLPMYDDGPHSPWFVQTGILLYSALARSRLHNLVDKRRAKRMVPELRTEGLRSCALYADAWTNDARLVIANLRGAENAGAVVVNYAEAVGLRPLEVRADGRTFRVDATRIVNASGPWVDHVRRLEDASARPSIRLSKGVHVLVDGAQDWQGALTIPHDKVRVTFAVPWEGKLLLGTTDTLYDGDPGQVEATGDDVRQVLEEAAVAVEPLGHPLVSFAGLRVLPITAGETATSRRETVFTVGPSGMLSVAGGKLTTYRRIALAALGQLGIRGVPQRPRPLPGAEGHAGVTWPAELDPGTRRHLWHLYGSLAADVLAPAAEDPTLLEQLVPERPDIRAQDRYARSHEWAATEEDVLRRRTTGWLGPPHPTRV